METIATLPAETWLPRVTGGEPASAQLVAFSQPHLFQFDEIWPPILRECREPDAGWLWEALHEDLAYQTGVEFAVLLNGDLAQGCLISSLPLQAHSLSRLEGLPVYVEYVAIAPWNRSKALSNRLFKAVGPTLLKHAVQRSLRLGRKGQIALHSAFASSTEWYDERLRMSDRGPDSHDEERRYFEGDAHWATTFLKGPA